MPFLSLIIITHQVGNAVQTQLSKVTIKNRDFLREAPVRKRLAARAEEGAASVLDGLDTQRELTGQLKKRRDGEEELGGATRLDDDFVRVDKEAGLREDVRVQVIVGERGHDLTCSRSEYFVKLGPGQSTETQALGVLEDAWLEERDLEPLLVAFETDCRQSHVAL